MLFLLDWKARSWYCRFLALYLITFMDKTSFTLNENVNIQNNR